MANVGTAPAGKTLIGTGNLSSPTFAFIGTSSGLSNHGVILGQGANAFVASNVATNGQLFIGATGADPAFGTLTSSDGSITFTTGVNTLNLQVAGVGKTITGDSGGALSPTLGNWNIVTANSTPKFVGSGSTLTQDFNLSNLVLGSSLPSLTSGIQNVGLGSGIFGSLNTGQANVAIGFASLNAIVGGLRNTALGAGALQKIVGDVDNTAVGYQALTNCVSANNNTAVGSFCLSSCTSSSNVGVGQATLGSLTSNGNCTAVGFSALTSATGGENTALGFQVMNSLVGGTQNLGLGTSAASNLLTGTRGIFIGYGAGQGYTGSESSDICIGNTGTIGDNNSIRIGTQGAGVGQQNQCFIAGIAGVTNSNNTLVTQNSSTGQLGATTAQFPNTAGTAGNLLTSDGTNWVSSAAPSGYALSLTQSAQFPAPADSTTYYVVYGATWGVSAAAGTTGRIWIPKGGTITAAYGSMSVQGTLGSAADVTVRIRLNDSTNTNITTTLQMNTVINLFNNTALSIAVSAGDYIHFQVVTPAWVTNPTNVVFNCAVFVS